LVICTQLVLAVCAAVCGAGEPRARREIAQGDEMAAAGNFQGAHRAFTRAIEADPASAEGYVKRAVCSILGRAFDPAIKDLSEAIRLDPAFEEAYRLRAWVYKITGSWDEALRDMRHVKNRPLPKPGSDLKDLLYPHVPSVLGIPQEQFRRVEEMTFFAAEWEASAEAVAHRDGLTKAEVKKQIAATPKDAAGFRERGRCYILALEFHKAVADLNKAVEMGASDADTFLLRALARGRRGDLPAAITDLNRCLEVAPASPRVFVVRGLARLGLGEHKRAIEDMTRAIERDPQDPNAFYARSHVYFEMGDLDKGSRDADEARALTSDSSDRLWEYSSRH
jgi:tetratricopeptide (TPR) repeat protein